MARDEDGSPGAGLDRFDQASGGQWLGGSALQETLQHRQQRHEHVTPPEIQDDPLLDASIFADGLDDAHILMDDAGGTRDFDGADEHDGVLASSEHPEKSSKLW